MYYYAETHGTNSWKFKKLLVKLLRHRYFYGLLRSSRSQMFFKIGVLKNFANFTGKHLHSSLFLRKLQTLRLLCWLQTPCKPSSSFYWKNIYRNVDLGPCQIAMIETFNGWMPLTVFTKSPISDVSQNLESASETFFPYAESLQSYYQLLYPYFS